MVVHQDAGLGLRVLLPQLSPQVFRFDFAIPFDEQMKRGLPLRFTAGINQAF